MNEAINQLNTSQNQLVESEKIASLGTLMAGFAHELNNPLNFINGGLDAVKRDLDELKQFIKKEHEVEARAIFEEISELLTHVAEDAQKAVLIIQNLLNNSPKQTSETFKPILIKELIIPTTSIIEKSHDFSMLDLDLDENLIVAGNPAELNQVIINVLKNAIYAILVGRKAKIKIITSAVDNDVK